MEENDNDMETAEALIRDVGVEAAISAAYRVGAVVESRPRSLVVKFETEQNHDEFTTTCTISEENNAGIKFQLSLI